ncbi:hypothetical protein [uncultured Streptomyces sp.]|uniref:hypothetical protein n=1 Tax=uncultured Streptomyces sp. TaxID=174707 RepID=UPI0026193508|nr:hypothetical protein [uncultured Streptomyces sp.]
MTERIHIGDAVTQHGDHNTGIVHHHTPPSEEEALRRLQIAVATLRPHLAEEDLPVVEAGMQTLAPGSGAEPSRVRLALTSIAGVATMIGSVGVPVVEAARGVMESWGGA